MRGEGEGPEHVVIILDIVFCEESVDLLELNRISDIHGNPFKSFWHAIGFLRDMNEREWDAFTCFTSATVFSASMAQLSSSNFSLNFGTGWEWKQTTKKGENGIDRHSAQPVYPKINEAFPHQQDVVESISVS
jgi:hypothetical protein